jgi:dTDP-4-amino-4,6-dideoxygalactose transaminase
VELQRLLRADTLTLFCNGTLALTMGLKALGLRGEIITTPFTFPATPHSIVWSNATPVFCDIDPETFCIDPDQISAEQEDCGKSTRGKRREAIVTMGPILDRLYCSKERDRKDQTVDGEVRPLTRRA